MNNNERLYFCIGSTHNFPVYEPLIKVARQRGIECSFVLFVKHKKITQEIIEAHPFQHPFRHLEYINKFCEDRGMSFLMGTAESLELNGKLISIEKRGMNNLLPKHNVSVHVLTRLGDCYANPEWFNYYAQRAENIFFIGETFSKNWGKSHPNIRYVGNPKYDAPINREGSLSKLNLDPKEKYITIFYPEHQFKPEFKISNLYKEIINCGYKILVKNRCVTVPSLYDTSPQQEGVLLFDDEQLYPSKALELMSVSDLTITFNSAATEESLFAEVPFLNFSRGAPFMSFLYNDTYSENLPINFDVKLIEKHIQRLTSPLSKEYIKKAKNSIFACVGDSSERVLDYIFNKKP